MDSFGSLDASLVEVQRDVKAWRIDVTSAAHEVVEKTESLDRWLAKLPTKRFVAGSMAAFVGAVGLLAALEDTLQSLVR